MFIYTDESKICFLMVSLVDELEKVATSIIRLKDYMIFLNS